MGCVSSGRGSMVAWHRGVLKVRGVATVFWTLNHKTIYSGNTQHTVRWLLLLHSKLVLTSNTLFGLCYVYTKITTSFSLPNLPVKPAGISRDLPIRILAVRL